VSSPSGHVSDSALPLRVSTLELFFDLVFVFTITQLTGMLARDVTLAAAGRVLLIFGVLWWMYGGYAWLTNTRTPSRAPERLLLLVGMAGFLIIGLSIPYAFGSNGAHGRDGLALGIGYLIVVAVHSGLYLRVNRDIWRIIPFNLTSPVLVIIAGLAPAPASYVLWVVALAIQVAGPAFVRLGGRFDIAAAHFVERHGALMIVAFGESVADVGAGAAGQRVTFALAMSAVLGLALTATLWWAFFGTGDDDRAEESLAGADSPQRPRLALLAYFYAYIPMLLGIIAVAAALKRALAHPGAGLPAGPALALTGGVALFMAGDAVFRRALTIGNPWYRAAGAAVALAAWPAAVAIDADAGILLLAAVVASTLLVEQYRQRAVKPPEPDPLEPLGVLARGACLRSQAVGHVRLVQLGCLLGKELTRLAAQCVPQDEPGDVLGQRAELAQGLGERGYLTRWHARLDEVVPHVPLEDAGEAFRDGVRGLLECLKFIEGFGCRDALACELGVDAQEAGVPHHDAGAVDGDQAHPDRARDDGRSDLLACEQFSELPQA